MGLHDRLPHGRRPSNRRRWSRPGPRRHLARPSRPGRVEAMLPWGVVLVGVGVMIGLMVSILVVPVSHTSRLGVPALEFAEPSPTRPSATPPATGGSGEGERDRSALRDVAAVRYSPTPTPLSSAPSAAERPPPPETDDPSPDPFLTGRYEVEEVYRDAFISKVVIKNESFHDRDWTVELAFGPDVGRLNAFWVDGTPQPVLDRSGEGYVFTSTVPVPAGSWVVLKLHLDRDGYGWDGGWGDHGWEGYGGDLYPTLCLVNGGECRAGHR